MRWTLNRLGLAMGLTALALAVPCAAWFWVGSRAVERQAQDLANAADRYARETAQRLAIRLSERLNRLLETESRRPFYHYQAYFHDPQGAYEGASVIPSPLVAGPDDPLIQCYFQADGETGTVTLPTAEADAGTQQRLRRTAADADADRRLRRELERGLASILFAVRGESAPLPADESGAATGLIAAPASAMRQAAAEAGPSAPLAAPVAPRVEEMEGQAWAQNVDAQELYSNLREGRKADAPAARRVKELKRAAPEAQVKIFVGPLKWRTLYLQGQPTLAALREVTTPENRRLQGFVIAPAGVADFFRAVDVAAGLMPGRPRSEQEAALELGGEPWRVSVDLRTGREKAQQAASDLRRHFFQMYGLGAGVAILAGLCVVGLVWQSDRLARQRAQFAASAAHELRTPLAGLQLYADMLANGLGDRGKSADYARSIAGEAERLGRVVGNVLGFSRLERGRMTVRPEPGDLAAAVRDAVARQRPALEAAGVRVELDAPPVLEGVLFDRDAVAQILQNLLDNAEKHTRAAARRELRVALEALPEGGAALRISDHGPGIAPADRRRLFKAFERGHRPDTPAGLGLGLVMVKALAEAQGGRVSQGDNEGGGSVFSVSFRPTSHRP